MSGNRLPGRLLSTAFGIIVVAAMLFPLYWMVNQSLQPGTGSGNNALFPAHPDFSAYAQVIGEQGSSLLTSLAIAVGCVIVTLVVAVPAAFSLAKFPGRAVTIVLTILLVSQMVPGIVIANALYGAYVDLGLLNSLPGLILADASVAIPFSILVMRAFMLSIPNELLDAARVDGAGPIRTLVSIVIPISRNSIITSALFSFLFAWSDFIFALTLTTSGKIRPVTLSIYDYLSSTIQDWAPVLATSVLSALPAVVLLVVAQRYVAAGALGGAVK